MAQTWTWTTVFIKPPFVIRSYGGKCLDFGPPPQLSGAPVFIYDCNGTIAQQVSIEEVNARHDVILRAGTKVIGVKSEVITRGVPAVAQLALLNGERALELQDAQNSEAQVFALDGDSIVQASNRNRVVKVLNNRCWRSSAMMCASRDCACADQPTAAMQMFPVPQAFSPATFTLVRSLIITTSQSGRMLRSQSG